MSKKQKYNGFETATQSTELFVQPHGGIGNQLFMYFGALYLAKKLNRNLCVSMPLEHKSFDIHRGRITDFRLEARIDFGDRVWSPKKTDLIYSRLVESNYCPKMLKQPIQGCIQQYHEKEPGYSGALEILTAPRAIAGYFQTWRYWEALPALSKFVFVTPPETNLVFSRFKARIKSQESIIMHIRRGDYLNNLGKMGVLGSTYYLNSIAFLRQNNVKGPIFIFSDDPDFVSREIGPFILGDWTLVDAERKLSPSETLQLMTFGKYFIIANSTFSWWAATLSGSEPTQIIAPSKWCKTGSDPIDLTPNSWMRQESIWVST
ncbi:Alpha-1,2-fucosyltransferase [Candidatus Planktophila versatilis]|uniref:alpha-1,2-fucosyltransferase n=1 Tax=Candidatus Planktophila versatilis TaxID=1884905 RepID=UPI000BAC7960|nr:alpha-1,2-fucosyltransferase [Candidatus Planktophila versatilis]ASY18018.1 Alpha-1,2-fucosyltransferase [Candidatus Planktophila versatilis]